MRYEIVYLKNRTENSNGERIRGYLDYSGNINDVGDDMTAMDAHRAFKTFADNINWLHITDYTMRPKYIKQFQISEIDKRSEKL